MAASNSFQLTFCNSFVRSLCVLFALTGFSSAPVATGAILSDGNRLPAEVVLRAQTTREATTLEPGKPIERQLEGGQEHRYELTLSQGQYANVTVDQHGIDAAVSLFGVDGKLVVEFEPEIRLNAQERFEFVAERTGVYRLAVASVMKGTAGRYEIAVTEIRASTEKDRLLQNARMLDTQAGILSDAGNYQEALPLAERAVQLGEEQLGPNHPYVGLLLNHLAEIYTTKSEFEKAEQSFQRALAINEKALGRGHPESVRSLVGLANHYLYTGEFAKSEQLFDQALEITEKTVGGEHPRLAMYLRDISMLHYLRGDMTSAEREMQRALSIVENSLQPDSWLLVQILSDMGLIYIGKKDYDRAEPLLQRSLEIVERRFGAESYRLTMQLQNLGLIAQEKRKDYARALDLYGRAVTILEKSVGPEDPKVVAILNNIANIHKSRGEYEKALDLHLRVHSSWEKTLGPYHGYTLISLGNIARTYAAIGDIPNAIKFQTLTDQAIEKNLALNLAIGSEREKLAYLNSLSDRTDRTISLHVNLAPNDLDVCELAALVILQRKGRVLDAMSGSLAALRERMQPEDLKLLDELSLTISQLAKLELGDRGPTPLDLHQRQLARLEEQKEKLESEISRRSSEFRAKSQTVTVPAVKAAIPRDAALVEFATYRPFDPKAQGNAEAYGSPHYIAYILRQQGEIRWKDLGATKEIDAAVAALRQALSDPQSKDVQGLARAVDERVMQPIRALLGDATRLLVSPDGELNLIPFEAMVDEHGRYLIERYAFTYLTSGRDLLRMQVPRESFSNPLLIANPLFGEPESEQTTGKLRAARPPTPPSIRRAVTTARDLSEVYFAPLGGTAQEAQAIKSLFPKAIVLTQQQATEAALKRAIAPSILHIATHGFFLQEAISTPADGVAAQRGINARVKIDNPLLRSGLALAGANLHAGGDDDGILTALEASGLNLWGTKLVVLSACDTGLGDVRNGEGVYGLRRALVLAGAESFVMSLWAVSDYVTRQMMTNYYRGLKQGLGRSESLRQVKLSSLKQPTSHHPYYWASFIQSGEWANLDGKR